mmetsp:Transcript_97202/g.278240  ORF Transcript_97202/g.278240 Transcript_97202/m.278240 type:complete len:101 (-) Transcript_97202:119-421(-)|eukprot:CAMPEP_0119541334 /NCGR_PEP_ID=MMETSP1344-20130328/52897_1 /TAXON_ID=236787 /ORGANISM="Florenciella parvula, Strain CCMP2471" /LENGTH=100 /DNA_ID=CAMNT_0007585293 /DNA_START=128 /DNA_END=430 /DNA_ORIENTATION=-
MFRTAVTTFKRAATPGSQPVRQIGSGIIGVKNGCQGASSVMHGPGIVQASQVLTEVTHAHVLPPAYVQKGCISSNVVHGPEVTLQAIRPPAEYVDTLRVA